MKNLSDPRRSCTATASRSVDPHAFKEEIGKVTTLAFPNALRAAEDAAMVAMLERDHIGACWK